MFKIKKIKGGGGKKTSGLLRAGLVTEATSFYCAYLYFETIRNTLTLVSRSNSDPNLFSLWCLLYYFLWWFEYN